MPCQLFKLSILLKSLLILSFLWLICPVLLYASRRQRYVGLLHLQRLLQQRILEVKYSNFLAESELVASHIVNFDRHRAQLLVLRRYRLKLCKLLLRCVSPTIALPTAPPIRSDRR